jgi:hypothetical protein
VLAELLRYFEKDEARHVGLGMQLQRAAGAVRAAVRTFRAGLAGEVPESSIDPDARPVRPSSIW